MKTRRISPPTLDTDRPEVDQPGDATGQAPDGTRQIAGLEAWEHLDEVAAGSEWDDPEGGIASACRASGHNPVDHLIERAITADGGHTGKTTLHRLGCELGGAARGMSGEQRILKAGTLQSCAEFVALLPGSAPTRRRIEDDASLHPLVRWSHPGHRRQ